MMNEASDRDDFELDGPLWIQVHAHDKGLEILVTRGQLSDGNMKLEIPVNDEVDTVDEKDNSSEDDNSRSEQPYDHLELIVGFKELEDMIALSHSVQPEYVENSLYHYEGRYYLYIYFNNDEYTEDEQDNLLSRMLEFGYESELTIHRLQEYGKVIMESDAIKKTKQTFKA